MKINVSRNKGWYARFRKLKLYLDDKYLSEIKAGEAMIIDIPLNAKKIHGKMDWKTTNVLSLENIKEDEQINIESNFNLNFFAFPIKIKKQKKL